MKELLNILRECFNILNRIECLKRQENKTPQIRNELKYHKQILRLNLKYLQEVISRELEKKEKEEN